MANVCESCGESCYRTVWRSGRFIGVDCRCYSEKVQASTINPYGDLTLDHVYGHDGKPIRVTSSRQLSRAEQDHNFISVVRNMDSANIDRAPQQRPMSVGDIYRRKFPRGA